MSRTVHLLEFVMENLDFFNQIKRMNGTILETILNKGKKYDKYIREIVDDFNKKRNILPVGADIFNALTVPKFKILVALVTQNRNPKFIEPLALRRLNEVDEIMNTPKRFQEHFAKLMVPGYWLLGTMIEDSLSENTSINRGNPFGFLPGDLGFWWAGAVIMDWANFSYLKKKDDKVRYEKCIDFYNDCCLSSKYKYCQRSSLSHMGRIPEQFLNTEDEKNFLDTIQNVEPPPLPPLYASILLKGEMF